ncbi:MAG TPA: PilT/PilU family type 4a pilus ATPase [Vicinamibacterales bacterium]|nr:PilT/PilU family type 4a pilus ATPase [Vicinamibacterales bacterium]
MATVLIVDDEPAVSHLEARMLAGEGYACIEAGTIAEALAALQRGHVSVALLDVNLPSGSGLALAHQIREYYPATAVVMVTANAQFSTAAEAMRAGAIDYLVKPVSSVALARTVGLAVARAATLGASASPSTPVSTVPRPDTWAAAKEPARIDRLFHAMCAMKASDLHLSVSLPPMVRKDGRMQPLEDGAPALEPHDVIQLLQPIVPGKSREEFEARHDSDFAYEIEGLARFRGNIFMDRKGMGAVFRVIPSRIMTAEELNLSPHVLKLCGLTKGLVLVTGPTGSGKSTTLSAMIDYINRTRDDHIITMEDPIEFVHPNQRCIVNQREVHTHTASFKDALRAALREDPDVLLVGEMRDLETIAIAIETAETGHLVFGTLHTTTAVSTVDRIIDQFPHERQSQVRVMLSESLKGIIAQTLCRKTAGGRAAALEVLLINPAISNLIREGKTFQIQSMMQVGKASGMVTLNESLAELVRSGAVAPEEALAKSVDKAGLEALFKRPGGTVPVRGS